MKVLCLLGPFVSGTDFVTCGSVVKLKNSGFQSRLHSHKVEYGSGSRQQSVTGVSSETSGNSYWWILGANEENEETQGGCLRGESVKCGSKITLTHINTSKKLRTHKYKSPLSNNQEVAADGQGTKWKVVCEGATLWQRDNAVSFYDDETKVWLGLSGKQFNRPIRGHMEVVGSSTKSAAYWQAVEGVFVSPQQSATHDEL